VGTDALVAEYRYDGLGNWRRTAYTPVGGAETTEVRRHNYLNQVTRFDDTDVLYDHGDNAASPDPDVARRGNGNLSDDGVRLYAYDALNRLVQVKRKSNGAVIAAYTYDGLGRRVRKVVSSGGLAGDIPNGATDYLYAGDECVEERNPFGGQGTTHTPLRQYVWGRYIDELLQQRDLASSRPRRMSYLQVVLFFRVPKTAGRASC
jgi:YD repeat-containing protein